MSDPYPTLYSPSITRVEAELIRAEVIARVECTVLGRSGEVGWSPRAQCELIYKPTGERIRLTALNIYDIGYMITADYEIAPGVTGGYSNFDPSTKAHYWMEYRKKEGWVRVRDLTEPELWCLRYLNEFPPVYDGLRT